MLYNIWQGKQKPDKIQTNVYMSITIFVLWTTRWQTWVKQEPCMWHSSRKDKAERKRNNMDNEQMEGTDNIRCEVVRAEQNENNTFQRIF